MSVVETKGLTKDYDVGSLFTKRHRALDHLDLTVEEGEIFGLIGPNGAGKTTTLKLLMGLVFPTEGEATILGRAIDDPSMKAEIGYLPEHPYFYDYLTGRELLDYFGRLFGIPSEQRKRRIEELLDRVGIAEAADVALRKYSKGMTQRLGIAQALINRPKLVFLDEPMSGLDPMGRREMTGIIRELRESGATVFFCSHVLPDVEQLCDRIAILNRGKLVEVGPLTEILDVSVNAVDVVVENLSGGLESELTSSARSVRRTGDRCQVALSTRAELDALLPRILSDGARLVSVNPVRETLEDHFVREVGAGDGGRL
ncbi:MAG TPA: ABC transporter ATP-binding protein [Vicinamibacteria bacterium]|nr:ABC transporter ATP-binding protein [Vicinamibacteria bacterium]